MDSLMALAISWVGLALIGSSIVLWVRSKRKRTQKRETKPIGADQVRRASDDFRSAWDNRDLIRRGGLGSARASHVSQTVYPASDTSSFSDGILLGALLSDSNRRDTCDSAAPIDAPSFAGFGGGDSAGGGASSSWDSGPSSDSSSSCSTDTSSYDSGSSCSDSGSSSSSDW